jgi:hypothetical protein
VPPEEVPLVAVLDVTAVKKLPQHHRHQRRAELQDFIDAAVAAIEAIVGPIEVTDPI